MILHRKKRGRESKRLKPHSAEWFEALYKTDRVLAEHIRKLLGDVCSTYDTFLVPKPDRGFSLTQTPILPYT
jgi:hypothetical protein